MRPFLLSLLLLPASACGGSTSEPRTSALLITLDTTVPEALSCYGADAAITPHLDRLAREGVVYENARTVAPITAPSHASMLTGLYPVRHSVRMNASMVLPESAVTVAERARDAGYQTAAFVGAVVLKREFGLAQGFQVYDEPGAGPSAAPDSASSRPGSEVADRAIRWLEERERGDPFFLWAHFFDPHIPYAPPEEFLQTAGRNPYLGEVAFTDHQIGRIVEVLRTENLLDETLIVVVADHGEGLQRHGEATHGPFAFDTTLDVPLVVRHPDGWGAGERFDDPVSVVDVHPTLIEALGLGSPGDVDGRSLHRRRVDPDRGVYFETYFGYIAFGWSQLAGWADSSGKYIHSSAPELYDTEADPDETTNLLGADEVDLEPYRRAIDRVASLPALVQEGLGRSEDRLKDQIEKLGYAGAGTEFFHIPHPLEASGRPGPHERIEPFDEFHRAEILLEEGRAAEAVRLLRSSLKGDPTNPTARHLLGLALMRLNRFREAIDELGQAAQLREGEWVSPYLNIGVCYDNLGLANEAIRFYQRALVHGGPPAALRRLIELLEQAGRSAETGVYREMLGG